MSMLQLILTDEKMNELLQFALSIREMHSGTVSSGWSKATIVLFDLIS